jgi:FMN reductase
MKRVVAISGSQGADSKTRRLVAAMAQEVAKTPGWQAEVYDLTRIGSLLGGAQARTNAVFELDQIWTAIETCDALIVGSPTYKASYAGLLKHLFDLLDMKALQGRPVAVAATARAPGHALMIEHQMKPLFAFFGAAVAPTGIFALDADFGEDLSPALTSRVAQAAAELRALVDGQDRRDRGTE